MRTPIALSLSVLLAGCSAAPPSSRMHADSPSGASAAVAASILNGIDLGAWGDRSHVGDRALLGLEASDGQRVVKRYLLVTLTDEVYRDSHGSTSVAFADGSRVDVIVAPPTRAVTLATFDEQGKPVRQSRGLIHERTLNHGLYFLHIAPATAAATRSTTSPATAPSSMPASGPIASRFAAPAEAMALAMATVFTFAQSSGRNPVLGELTMAVIDRPSLLEVLGGLTLDIQLVSIEPCEATVAGQRWPATRTRFDVRLNDRSALLADVTAIPPAPPLGLVSGIVSIDGRNPTDPTRRLHVELLAARHGEGAAIDAYRVRGLAVPTLIDAPP